MRRLGQRHPHPVRRYERLCTEGAYAPQWYQRRITRYVHEPATEFGIGPSHHGSARRLPLRHGRWSPLDGSEPPGRPCSDRADVTYPGPGPGASREGKWVNSHQNRSSGRECGEHAAGAAPHAAAFPHHGRPYDETSRNSVRRRCDGRRSGDRRAAPGDRRHRHAAHRGAAHVDRLRYRVVPEAAVLIGQHSARS